MLDYAVRPSASLASRSGRALAILNGTDLNWPSGVILTSSLLSNPFSPQVAEDIVAKSQFDQIYQPPRRLPSVPEAFQEQTL
jgi:hypothetical protein